MEDQVTRPFVIEVLSRMKKPSGLSAEAKTVAQYTHRVMTLKNMGLANYLGEPDELYRQLQSKYDRFTSVVSLFRPSGAFAGNLTEDEMKELGFKRGAEEIRKQYSNLLTQATARRKMEADAKRSNA